MAFNYGIQVQSNETVTSVTTRSRKKITTNSFVGNGLGSQLGPNGRFFSDTTYNSFSGQDYLSILKLVFCILILIALFNSIGGGSTKTFFSFIDYLTHIEIIPVQTILEFYQRLEITGSWGIFEFLRQFINALTGTVGFVSFLSATIVNFVPMIFGFLGWAFA